MSTQGADLGRDASVAVRRNDLVALVIVLVAGYFVSVWAMCSSAADAYDFWTRGIERQAVAVRLDHVSVTRSWSTYYYAMQVDDNVVIKPFGERLDPGYAYAVLEVPGRPEFILGAARSNPFQIFVSQMGGGTMGWLALIFLPLLIISGPFFLPFIVKKSLGRAR